jgi:4,5-DOPA dioxygenase extradiol
MHPALFLSHGSPVLPLTDVPARRFLLELGQRIDQRYGRPKAILVASAHWETDAPTINTMPINATIHDFYGFPEMLYRLRYPAPGSTELATRTLALLKDAGLPGTTNATRGLDHGAWVPLLMMYPDATIPVAQISIQPHLDPAHHLRLGQALAALRDEGVLIIGSGGFTHNLREIGAFRGDVAAPSPAWVADFSGWFDRALAEKRINDLLDYRRLAPNAVRNHPTDEHLLPLFVALGAGGDAAPDHLHDTATYAILRMDAWAFS